MPSPGAEFLCGPLNPDQGPLAAALFPRPELFTPDDAARAADLFNATGCRRGSLLDCMIAATALRAGAALATENPDDFRRFEPLGLRLAPP